MNKPIELTRYQWRILTFLQGYIAQHRMSPSIDEIAIGVGISSTSVVNFNLTKLQEAGLLKRSRGITRSIALCKPVAPVAVIP